MRYWGKLLGFIFGFMLSKHVIGALVGLWLGHKFDKAIKGSFNHLGSKKEQERQAAFFYSSFAIMGHIAKAKGHVSSHEIAFANAYMTKLRLSSSLKAQAKSAFGEGKQENFPLSDCLKNFKKLCGDRPELILVFLEIQIQVAFADGALADAERKALHNVASILGFSVRELDNLLDMMIAGESFHHQQGSYSHGVNHTQLSQAYKVLGLSDKASEQELKKAYRKLMTQHHPDKLIAKGLPPEMMEAANQKAQDIQAAYDLIKKNRAA